MSNSDDSTTTGSDASDQSQPVAPVDPPHVDPAPSDVTVEPFTGTYGVPVEAAAPAPNAIVRPFLIGVGAAIVTSVAGLLVIQSGGGGLLWFGGYFVAFSSLSRAWKIHQRSKSQTGVGLSQPMRIGGAALAIAALVLTGLFASTYINKKSHPLTATVGSCWAQDGDKAVLVACDNSDARFTAVAIEASSDSCPASAESYVYDETSKQYICLQAK